MDEDAIERAVLGYLKRKGYKSTELAFKDEARMQPMEEMVQGQHNIDASVLNSILFHNKFGNTPAGYRDGYMKLQSWIHQSLDMYRGELLRVLYPAFVHSFLDMVAKGYSKDALEFFQSVREEHDKMHLRDMQRLEGISLPQHLQENELAKTFRENKINVKLCQYTYELLMQYLNNSESMQMLGILNEHLNFQVYPGQPQPSTEETEEAAAATTTVTGRTPEALETLNEREILWPPLENSIEHKLELKMAEEAAQEEAKEKEGEGADVKGADGKPLPPSKKAKKDAKGARTGRAGATALAGINRVKSNIPLPQLSQEAEKAALQDLRRRIQLSSTALPSVAFYTFINTFNGLNYVSLSNNGALAAGGFSDSSIKVFDMSGGKATGIAPRKNATLDAAARTGSGAAGAASGGEAAGGGAGAGELEPPPDVPPRTFIGHAGPVYGMDFSPDSQFLLSGSSDCTVRLWSMELNTNLVCYKGHNYPVWDVKYSPLGYYFASTSHDRTARIWSMDRTQPLRILAGHLSDVDCVCWHVNCNYVATGSSDRTVRLWEVASGECVRLLTGHRGSVMALAASPCGRYLASGDEDGAVMVWDLGSGRRLAPLWGHTGPVWTLAFSGEGSLLASGSADETVRLWDISSSTKAAPKAEAGKPPQANQRRLRLLKTLTTRATPVYSLKFSRRNLLLGAGAFCAPKPTPAT